MHARRAATLLLPTALALSRAAAGEFGDPIRGLSPDELQRFGDGRAAFETVEDVADGLGPVLNGTSCAACHRVGGTGGGSETVETRFGTMTNGVFDPLVNLGGPLIQTDGIALGKVVHDRGRDDRDDAAGSRIAAPALLEPADHAVGGGEPEGATARQ